MHSIYYPYYMIEKNGNKSKKYNHKRNLCVLALFCDHILIPLRHLLTMNDEEFNELTANKIIWQT